MPDRAGRRGVIENSWRGQLKDPHRNPVRLWRARFTQQRAKSIWGLTTVEGRPTHLWTRRPHPSIIDTHPCIQAPRQKPVERPHWPSAPGGQQVDGEQYLAEYQLQAHRVKGFKPFARSSFLEQLTDVVGPIMNPTGAGVVRGVA